MQLFQEKTLKRLNPSRFTLIQPRLELVLALDEPERCRLAHLPERSEEVERLRGHAGARVRTGALCGRLRQHVAQKRQLARQTKLPLARVPHQHPRSKLRDEVQHLQHRVHVAVGQVVDQT